MGWLCILVGAGCTLLVDSDGLSGGAPSREPPPPDVTRDGASAPITDGSTDALGEADATDHRPFCDRAQHVFCRDFTDPSVVAGWTFKEEVNGGTLAHTATEGATSPGALVVEAPAFGAAMPLELAQLEKRDYSWNSATWDYEFAVRPETVPEVHRTSLATILVGNAIIYLTASQEGLSFFTAVYGLDVCPTDGQMCNALEKAGTRPLPTGEWSTIHLSLFPGDAGASHVVLKVRGLTELDMDLRPEFHVRSTYNPSLLRIGIPVAESASSGRRFLFDDVAIDLVP